jgi:hypothetical protein
MSATELAERPVDASGVQSLTNGAKGNGRRLSNRAKGLILSLTDAGKNASEVAQVIGCAVSTVTRTLDELVDNRVLARRQLEAAAPKLVKTITQSKDAATALRTLGKLDVVRDDGPNSSTNVLISIGQPGQSLAPPSIAITAGTEIRPLSPVVINDLACGNEG